jgi:hypothetical protein
MLEISLIRLFHRYVTPTVGAANIPASQPHLLQCVGCYATNVEFRH